MGKKRTITAEQLDWLRTAVNDGTSRREMAAYLAVCEDTARRILHRNGILEFDGAKFHSLPPTLMWSKPCLYCKCDEPRPKNQYICDPCKKERDGEY